MIGKAIIYKGKKYKVIDSSILGNNPPGYWYYLEGEDGRIYLMDTRNDDRDYHFKEIKHWKICRDE